MDTSLRILLTTLFVLSGWHIGGQIASSMDTNVAEAGSMAETGSAVVYDERTPSIAHVHSHSCGSEAPMTGTAWVAGKNLLVTGAHVIVGGDEITVGYGPDGSESIQRARVVGYDPATDLALLASDTGTLPALPLMNPQQGMDLDMAYESIGYPRSRLLESSPLRLLGVAEHDVRGRIYSFAGTVEPGDSGSPVFDSKGIVSGVVFGTSSDYKHAYITPIEYVHALIKQSQTQDWATVPNGECGDVIGF